MHGRPVTRSPGQDDLGLDHPSHPNRWRILGVLVLALLVTSIDHTIINVAMPRLVEALGASSAGLQWIVASYTIVFAGLLLTAGSFGDRFGRRPALLGGVATFLMGSVVAASAGSTAALIAGRCAMGFGGALIMPTTLSILVNVFGDPRERAKAIAAWTAASGVGIAVGPIVGGLLMRHLSWSSVFWINVPLLVAAFFGAVHLVPDSRDPGAARVDPVGALLSIGAISSLVYAIIQAPGRGWTSTASLATFAGGTAVGILFIVWEGRRDEPMFDVGLFRRRGFSAGSMVLTLLFFAMAGTVFLQAQYLQFVLGYSPLAAGFALVPAALGMLVGTGGGAHLAARHGGRITVAVGTLTAAAGVAVQAALVDGGSYVPTGVGLLLFGLGAGIAMPAATELIMAAVPPARAGVGSAVNDTVREVGGALGVAVIGSAAATSYTSSMQHELDRFPGLAEIERTVLTDNVGAALQVSEHLGAPGEQIASAARDAFVGSMNSSLWIAAALAFGAAVVAFTRLPGHGPHSGEATGRSTPEVPRKEPSSRTDPDPTVSIGRSRREPVVRVVGASVAAGLAGAVLLTLGVYGGATEHVISGSALLAFGGGWAMLAVLSARFTSRPQRWAWVPAAVMAVAGMALLLGRPDDQALDTAGWVWPPVALALAVWMLARIRRGVDRRARWLLYPVVAAVALGAIGGTYETALADDQPASTAPGSLLDVGGHRLHLYCTGTGGPTVVLEGGLGGMSAGWARIRGDVERSSRVCAYDRAGQGWSDDVDGPQDGLAVAADLHTLLVRAGEPGPYVLVGHSAGGPYVMTFAAQYPDEVAGMVLLDSMSPYEFDDLPGFAGEQSMMRRGLGVLPSLARLGAGRVLPTSVWSSLPEPAASQVQTFASSPRGMRNQRDEQSMYRTVFAQAKALTSLDDKPLVVVTATETMHKHDEWAGLQDRLVALSTNSQHRVADATHAGLIDDEESVGSSAQAIAGVVRSVRTGRPVSAA